MEETKALKSEAGSREVWFGGKQEEARKGLTSSPCGDPSFGCAKQEGVSRCYLHSCFMMLEPHLGFLQ